MHRSFALVGCLIGLSAQAQPAPEPIARSGLEVRLIDVARLPASSASAPTARLNLLIAAPDESGRLFVNDMRGMLWILRGKSVDAVPFLDVDAFLGADLDTTSLQTGLSSFAFHPDYAVAGVAGEGRLYTVTSESVSTGTADFSNPFGQTTHYSVLSEWKVATSNPDAIDTRSRRVLMRIAEPHRDHNMGQIGFDPNATPGDADYGMLYIATGDGGNYFALAGDEIDPQRTAQNPSNPFGCILRIDPLGGSTPSSPTNGQYGIPPDNPFVGNTAEILEEVWAYGFRNPHRFSWDTGGQGTMFISDIGQVGAEEINIGIAGGNYGWSEREGNFVLNHFDQEDALPRPVDDANFGFLYPAAQYGHEEGFAVVGGFVYRGSLVPQLTGHYVFGDIVNGRIFHVPVEELLGTDPITGANSPKIGELTLLVDGVETTLVEQVADSRTDLRFGIDADGEIYILTKRDGMVRALLPEPGEAVSHAVALLVLASMASTARRAVRRAVRESLRGPSVRSLVRKTTASGHPATATNPSPNDHRVILQLQPALQDVHQVAETHRPPERLPLAVVRRDANLAAVESTLLDPSVGAFDQPAPQPATARGNSNQQVRNFGALALDQNGRSAIDPNGAEAQQMARRRVAYEDGSVRVSEHRVYQASNFPIRSGPEREDRVDLRVVGGERRPQCGERVQVAPTCATYLGDAIRVIRLRSRGLPTLACRGHWPFGWASCRCSSGPVCQPFASSGRFHDVCHRGRTDRAECCRRTRSVRSCTA